MVVRGFGVFLGESILGEGWYSGIFFVFGSYGLRGVFRSWCGIASTVCCSSGFWVLLFFCRILSVWWTTVGVARSF